MWKSNERRAKGDQARPTVSAPPPDDDNDDEAEAEGKAEETVGKVEAAVGGVARKALESVLHLVPKRPK